MRFFRVFAPSSQFKIWFDKKPKLSLLLKCFDVDRQVGSEKQVKPVSVFEGATAAQELQNVAAVLQKDPSTVEKRYAVEVCDHDCVEAGLEVHPSTGDTGIESVDGRHADLIGTRGQFTGLVAAICRRLWEGEQRLHAYPAHAILGEVAVLSRLGQGIDEHARHRCCEVLQRSEDAHKFSEDDAERAVTILGQMDDKEVVDIVARRTLTPS